MGKHLGRLYIRCGLRELGTANASPGKHGRQLASKFLWQSQKRRPVGKAARSARLGVCLLIPYRDAPDKCSQNNTQQSQGGLLPKVRHH
jgi:hypothetical protein